MFATIIFTFNLIYKESKLILIIIYKIKKDSNSINKNSINQKYSEVFFNFYRRYKMMCGLSLLINGT